MIIWISGAYGVGKTTAAAALAEKMENVLLFDAEAVGDAVRGNYPNDPYGYIYEDYPLWCDFCRKLLADIHNTFHKDILVPITLLRESSYGSILKPLADAGIDTKLFVLDASYQTIHDRILQRGEEEGCWCMENIELARIGVCTLPNGIRIETDDISAEQIAQRIFDMI